jgi:RHS repeat-associated protein
MTRQTFNGIDIQYIFPAANNDGRVERRVFTASGVSEDVSYSYDVLGRLTRAETAGAEWGQAFVYDGLGNLVQKNVAKGSAPAMSLTVNGATNRVTGWSYDANGNVTQGPLGTYAYDSVNRLTRADTAWGYEEYGYAANNQRLWKTKSDGTMEVYFYLPDGRLVATYERIWRYYPTEWCLKRTSERVWFGGTLLVADRAAVYTDRLGSVVSRGTPGTTEVYRYYPHGEAFAGNPSTTGPHFGTYDRDQHAGLDQAWNRGYLNAYGRSAQADPYQASGGAGEPGSWNRYGYVQGDPVNFHDPRGLMQEAPTFSITVTASAMGLGDLEFWWAMTRRNWISEPGGGGGPAPPEPGGGGGGGYVQVQPKVPAGNKYTRAQMQGLTNGLNNALTHTDQVDCATFFAGGDEDPSLRVAGVLENTLYRLVPLPQGPGTGAQTIDVGNVMINTAGAFFNAAPNANGTVTVGMPNAAGVQTLFTFADTSTLRGFMLLHELGHQMAVFGADINAAVNGANSQAVLDHCFSRDAQGIYH